jgi:hypothetical protein
MSFFSALEASTGFVVITSLRTVRLVVSLLAALETAFLPLARVISCLRTVGL